MLKVMVVDDELMIRRGLRCAIDWSVWGLQFCGDAGSGAEALEMARRHHPEIVITDIRMPLMDGLELAQQLRDMIPDIKIVFLTGYEDISYLKKAMEMGIKDYLLKPAGMSEIIPVVARLRDEIKQERDRKSHLESRDSLLEDSLPVLQSHFIDGLLSGRQNPQTAMAKAAELHINLDGPQYRLILAEIRSKDFSNRDPQPSMSIWLLIRIMQEVLESHDVKTFACRLPGDDIMILLNEPTGYGIDRDHLERITRLAYTQLGLEIVLLASGTVDSLEQLPIVSKQCQRCQAHQPWAEHQRIFIWEELQSSFSGVTPDTRAYENQIFASINDNSQLNLSIIRRIFDAFQETGASFEELKRRCLRILTVAKFLENGYQLDFDPEDRINNVRTASKLYSEMESILQSLNLSVEKAAVPSIQDKVLAYVHDHFHENISLEQLAAKLFLSPSYLGRVLRTDLGMHFHEWLNRYRINRACELLKNRNLKTSEIALMVGFSSYKYFSQIFAQHMGCSTREYRNRLIGSGG